MKFRKVKVEPTTTMFTSPTVAKFHSTAVKSLMRHEEVYSVFGQIIYLLTIAVFTKIGACLTCPLAIQLPPQLGVSDLPAPIPVSSAVIAMVSIVWAAEAIISSLAIGSQIKVNTVLYFTISELIWIHCK
ncbi:hypothetical protein D3C71_1180950 [compost metagenome]